MSNLSDLSDFPTFIGIIPKKVNEEILFICRSWDDDHEHYNVIVKPTLSDILFNGDQYFTADDCGEYTYCRISIGNFIKNLIKGVPSYVDILSDVKRFKMNRNYFRQYKDGLEIVDGCIDGHKVYTTLDMIMLLDQMEKLNEGILKYLLEIEYGIKQVEMVELFNLTCTKYE